MVIDTHCHIGKMLNFDMPADMLLASMEKYNIDFALVSSIDATEADHHQVVLPKEDQKDQILLNEELLDIVKKNSKKLGALLWAKPLTQGCSPAFEKLISENREYVYGIKFHPYHSKISLASDEVDKYIQLARKYKLPVVTHTATDHGSSPEVAYEVALKNPDINFVMVHMGLGTDNEKAIELISKLPNLYGDTTWVSPEKALKAIKACGIDKIMFGTDNPIDGLDTYNHDYYEIYLKKMKGLSKEDYEKLMYKNALKLFKISI